MDILVSSNFERLLWFLAYEFAAEAGMDDEWTKKQAGQEVDAWLRDLKAKGGFGVYKAVQMSAQRDFDSERVDDEQTVATIKDFYGRLGYILDPHTAVGVAAALRSMARAGREVPHVSLSTAHPAKFANAVDRALVGMEGYDFEAKVLPSEFVGMQDREKRVAFVDNSWEAVRELVRKQVEEELREDAAAAKAEIEAAEE
jgi:threonine synthase